MRWCACYSAVYELIRVLCSGVIYASENPAMCITLYNEDVIGGAQPHAQ